MYPDSIPYHEYQINEKKAEKPKGEIDFLKKYKKAIEFGRRLHEGDEEDEI